MEQKTSTLFSFNGLWALSACAIAMFSTLPLLILYYTEINKSAASIQKTPVKKQKIESAVETKSIEDDTWEPASVEDLHSGEFELES